MSLQTRFAFGRWIVPLLAASALAVVAAGCYWGRLGGPFLFDDEGAIVENATLRQLDLGVLVPPRETPVAGRPLVNVTFAVDYALFGPLPEAFHRTNLFLHVACCFVLFLFLRWGLRTARMPEAIRAHADVCAMASALLFCAHPLASEVVLYTSQRSETLMALCYLTVLYLLAREPEQPRRLRWFAVALVALLGVMAKEVFVTAPIVALCFDRAFMSGSFAAALRLRKGFYLAFCPALLLLGLLQLSNPRPDSVRWFEVDYVLAQAEVVPRYLAAAFWPARLTLDYGPLWPDAPIPRWPWLFGSAIGLVGVCWLILTRPRAGFGVLFMLLYLAPTSSLLSIHTEVGAERRFYLPLGVLISQVVVGFAVLCHGRSQRRAIRAGVLALGGVAFVALALRTHRRGADYASLRGAWLAAVEARPQNARAHYNLAETYRREREPMAAIAEYDAALALHDVYPDAHSNLGGVLLGRGEISLALRHSARAVELAPDSARLHSNYALALGLSGDTSAAVSELREAVRLAPDDLDLQVRLASALAIAGERAEARTLAQRVLKRAPEHPIALRLLRSLD